jgi:hypothetical protein
MRLTDATIIRRSCGVMAMTTTITVAVTIETNRR